MKNTKGLTFAQIYDKIYHSRDDEKETSFISFVYKKFGNKGKALMDMACGTGEQAIKLDKLGFNVIGVDIDDDMIKLSKKKTDKVQFLIGDMKSFRIAKKFDIITCLFSAINYNKNQHELEHTLINFYSHLNKGGICIFDLGFVNKKKDRFVNQSCFLETIVLGNMEIARISQWAISQKNDFIYDTQDLILVKENGKVDFVVDKHELGLFEIQDVKKIMKKLGFKVHIFETWSTKNYNNKSQTRRPIFVGVKQ